MEDDFENAEIVLFSVKECYVYMIPPRKSAASYRADEWNVNKWAWEGVMKVVSRGEACTIRLEDKISGELFAQAPIKKGEPLPLEDVIDSSRYFVLRIEDTSSGKARHAFIGIGFREREQAYDFQAAIYDHVKYLNKKEHAEKMEKEYLEKPLVDLSLKEGEKLHLEIKAPIRASRPVKSKYFEQSTSSLDAHVLEQPSNLTPLVLPPPPTLSASSCEISFVSGKPVHLVSESQTRNEQTVNIAGSESKLDDDFGDFQVA